jgi:hypothetical protein
MLAGAMNGTGDSLTIVSHDSHAELLRAAALCHPCYTGLHPVTFAPDSGCSPVWRRWKEAVLVPVLLPELRKARIACAEGDVRALADCDRAIDAGLPADLKRLSRTSGEALLEDYAPPRHERSWSRYRDQLASGEVPGHLGIVCALRASAFCLSASSLTTAYIFLEAQAGLSNDGMPLWLKMVSDCLSGGNSFGAFSLRAA